MLGNYRSGFLVVYVRMRIFLFELAQGLDAMVGENYQIGVFIDMLEDRAKHFVKRNVLVREGIEPDVIDAWIVANIERRDGVEPVPGAVFTRLRQESEIRGVLGQQIIEKLGLLFANELHLPQPLIDQFGFTTLQIARGRHTLAVNIEIADVFQELGLHALRIHGVPAHHFAQLRRAKHAIFAVLPAGQHAADHVAVHRHDGESSRDVRHAHGDPTFREHRPDRLFLQHVRVGGDAADDKAGYAMFFRIRAGKERAVYARAIGCGNGAEFSVGALLDHARQIGHLPFQQERADHVQLHAIDAQDDDARFWLRSSLLLTKYRESQEKDG